MTFRITSKDRERYGQMQQREDELGKVGYRLIAGVDEVGRGPLAGPVCAACCILPQDNPLYGLNDSKKLSEAKREYLYAQLQSQALAFSVAMLSPAEIDELNILEATKKAMRQCILALQPQPDIVLIDALTLKNLPYPVEGIIKGDAKCNAIAAASIIAKVTRDRLMREYDKIYPEYNFAANKGYGTAEHIEALLKFGKTPIHRLSFIKKITGHNSHTYEDGIRAENFVATWLEQRGYTIMHRRLRQKIGGELDLVARKQNVICFVEVKTRIAENYEAYEAFSPEQQARIKKAATFYLSSHDCQNVDTGFLFADVKLRDGKLPELHIYEF